MTERGKPDRPRQDAFALLNELLAMGHFSSRNDVQEAMQMLRDHLGIDQADAQELLIEWMTLQGRVYQARRD